jgi:hypothetical protein
MLKTIFAKRFERRKTSELKRRRFSRTTGLLQLRVFRLGLFQDGDVRVGVFPGALELPDQIRYSNTSARHQGTRDSLPWRERTESYKTGTSDDQENRKFAGSNAPQRGLPTERTL